MTISPALASQGRVLHALMLREIKTRFGKMKLGYLWALIEPMLFIGVFATIWYVLGTEPAGLPLMPFLVTGFGTFMFFRNLLQFPMMGIHINRSLLTYPQVTPFGIIVSRGILELATVTLVYAMLFLISAALGYEVELEDPFRLAGALLLLALLGLGASFITSTLVPIFASTPEIVGAFVQRPAFLLSGTFYTADMMPEKVRGWLMLNPVMHGTELARSAVFHGFESERGSFAYLASWALGTLLFGMLLQRALRDKLTVPS